MKEYLPRIIDNQLKEYLDMIGAVLITGPKWCGKTTTSEQFAKSVLKMQDPDKTQGYLATAETKPSLLLQGDNPRLVDEWQIAPVLWDAVRTAVDNRQEEGLFILTGSTTLDESEIMHTGTGRIARLNMGTMSLFESCESNGKISLNALFENPNLDIDGHTSDLTIEELIFVTCRGGWPAALNKKRKRSNLFVASTYVDSICESDASTIDNVKRDPRKVRAILASIARNLATLATNQTILKDVRANFADISDVTLSSYMDALSRLFVLDDISGWTPAIRSASAMRSGKKRLFSDPSIAAAVLNLSPERLQTDLSTFGFMFENLCIRDLKAYSGSMDGYVSYYHDRYGLEADCVLHLKDGRYALIEFKLGSSEIEEGASHLVELKNLIEENNEEKSTQIQAPSFLAVITGGEKAYTRKDGVKIIPIGCLRN